MAIRNILQAEEDVLHKVCKPVEEVNDRIRVLLDDLTETLATVQGVGLAAPQVGILRRVCVVDLWDGENHYEMINPVIKFAEGDQYGEEGCLSYDGMCGDVHRPQHVIVSCLDRNGNEVEYEGYDLLARAFCHEIDHLDGIMYMEKADNVRPVSCDEEEEQ